MRCFSALFRIGLLIISSISCMSASGLQPLPPEEAFKVQAQMQQNPAGVQIQFDLAQGYYLYRHTIKVDQIQPNVSHDELQLPAGSTHHDEWLGQFQALENQFTALLPIHGALPPSASITLSFQGCSSSGFCYPPMQRVLSLGTTASNTTQRSELELFWSALKNAKGGEFSFAALFNQLHLGWILLIFLAIGALLAFTPCVLPTLPILAGMILGQKEAVTAKRSFFLALSYLTGMTLTYTLAGTVAGLAGGYWQASVQSPWMSGVMSVFILLFALYLFDLIKLDRLQRISSAVHKLHLPHWQGTYLGALALGSLVTLLISPCVTPPLIGVITFIAENGNPWIGASALFALGVGMSIPLLLICTLGSEWLQHFRKISLAVKHFFGWTLIGLAIYLAAPFLPTQTLDILWGGFGLCVAIACGLFVPPSILTWRVILGRFFALCMFIVGLYFLNQAVQSQTLPDPPNLPAASTTESFQTVTSLDALTPLLAKAQAQHRPVLIDFYADWCGSCRHMEHDVFENAAVQQALQPYQNIKVDITANDSAAKKLLSVYDVVAPPTIIFLDSNGREMPHSRIIGEVSAKQFLDSLPKKPT